jgi:hypothetical protein
VERAFSLRNVAAFKPRHEVCTKIIIAQLSTGDRGENETMMMRAQPRVQPLSPLDADGHDPLTSLAIQLYQ